MRETEIMSLKEVVWVGTSLDDLKELPRLVQKEVGYALQEVQSGAKPLREFGAGVFEIRVNYDTNTYRAVYTIKLGDVIYVLHVFQKKSKTGIKTPLQEIVLIKRRLLIAKEKAAIRRVN